MAVESIKAAKAHTCHWCSTEIAKGSSYNLYKTSDWGTSRLRFHEECYLPWRSADRPTEPRNESRPPPKGYTVIIVRAPELQHAKFDTINVSTTVFIARVEGGVRSDAADAAIKQALKYDLDEYANWPEKYNRKPRAEYYNAIQSMHGYPAIIRPE